MASYPTATPAQRLAQICLGGDDALSEFVRSRRSEGRSWRLIARDLLDATNREVDVSHETLRTWFPDEPTEKAS